MRSDNQYATERGEHNPSESEVDFRERSREVNVQSVGHPTPGMEVVGPTMFNLVQETRRAIDIQSRLLQAAIPLLDNRRITDYATGQTDANGNLDLPMYRVPAGMQFVMTRLNVEDGTHTPGAGFTAAGCWIAVIRGDKFSPGSMVDFLPNPPNNNGIIIPALFSDGNSEAAVYKGGEVITLHVVGTVTLANTDIWARFQGELTQL